MAPAELPAAAAAGAFAPAATYDAAAVATVVAHAAARGIRVVPEFDTPAHAGGFFLSRPDLFCGDTYADAVLDPERAWKEMMALQTVDGGASKASLLYWIATRPPPDAETKALLAKAEAGG